jgi:FKBP-type peptidyl-prolyl cis-trans isomerase FkpA
MLSLLSCQKESARVTPETQEQKLLYMFGVMAARQRNDFHLTAQDLEYVYRGMRDQVRREKRAMELELTDEVKEMVQRRKQALMAQEQQRSSTFLEQVAREQGVVKTQSGLLFRSLAEGTGPSPTVEDTVTVHCRGLGMNGAEFANSYKEGMPRQFPVGRTLRCLSEGLQLMKVGGKAKLVCPTELAFNVVGLGKQVPPGAAVIFELELLEIVRAE